MRNCRGRYLRTVCNWPSAALIAAVGFVAKPSCEGNRSIHFESKSEVQSTAKGCRPTNLIANPYEPPWWKKLFGVTQHKDEILDKYISDYVGRNEHVNEVKRGQVLMYETNWIAANNPVEDRHSEYLLKDSELLFFGVFDGHSGWHCSESVRNRLPVYAALSLTDSFTLASYLSDKNFTPSSVVDALSDNRDEYQAVNLPQTFFERQAAIGCGERAFISELEKENAPVSLEDGLKKAFTHLDNHICTEAIPGGKVDESLLTGIAGSCAIVAIVGQDDVTLANAGDCRAVLGRRTRNGGWQALELTSDHCAENKAEVKRLDESHPDQKGRVVVNGRLLGQLQPLRAFGDVQYKWSKVLHERVLHVVYGRPVVPASMYKSPPYLVAEPEITKHHLQPDDRFLIMATDGLWEKVSNEHAVKIIGDYVDRNFERSDGGGNGATRLIRYALGKGNEQTVAKMLQIPQAHKRNFHDDITITIVYFDSSYSPMSKL